jgi:hypothetical protein
MTFRKLYKYKITDLTTGYYNQNGNLGECYLPIAPSRDQVISEYYKKCSHKDKEAVDDSYHLFKIQITCGRLPNTVFVLFRDMAIASFEPQRDQ